MPPLPHFDDELVACLTSAQKHAYVDIVLPAEADAVNDGDDLDLMLIRVLGALLIHAPTPTARESVYADIMVTAENIHADGPLALDKLTQLGKCYFDRFTRLFARRKAHAPSPPSDSPQPWVQGEPVQTPKTHSDAHHNALIRDGFRCMASGYVDAAVYKAHVDAFEKNVFIGGNMHSCHILPDSTESFPPFDELETERKQKCEWTMLTHFGYGDIREELQGAASHSLRNVLTLRHDLHVEFHDLCFWFEAVPDKEHTYTTHLHPPTSRYHGLSDTVQFAVHTLDLPGFPRPDAAHLPLPDPRYLEIHATWCKVAHMSGATECEETLAREVEEGTVLAEDGGSAGVLAYVLARLAALS